MAPVKVLVLGGGHGQLSLICRLKADGAQVLIQDRSPKCPARSLADEFIRADTKDADAAAEVAKRFKVDAVLTSGTDQPVLAAAVAARKRGCPSLISVGSARAVTDKEVMRGRLKEAGLPMPDHRFAGPSDGSEVLRGLRPPYVVKPVDSQGQRGVVKMDSADEFVRVRDASLEWSGRKRLIIEEYHQNREITISGWIYRGQLKIWAVTDRVTRDFLPHIGLCLAHRFPSTYAAGWTDEVIDITRRCTETLGIENGPIYFQFLVTDQGLLINETAARLGGAYEDESLPPVCGNEPVGLLITGALEGSADPSERKHTVAVSAGAFSVPLMFCRPGRISGLSDESKVRLLPGVTSFHHLLTPGVQIGALKNSVQRSAYLVVHGQTPSDVNRVLKRAYPRIRQWDENDRGLLMNSIAYTMFPA